MGNDILKTAGTALVSAAMTFGANALSLSGRVEALEKGQAEVKVLLIQALRVPPAPLEVKP